MYFLGWKCCSRLLLVLKTGSLMQLLADGVGGGCVGSREMFEARVGGSGASHGLNGEELDCWWGCFLSVVSRK